MMTPTKLTAVAVAAVMVLATAGAVRADSVSDDKKFVADSAQDSLAEINYAKLALQKSQDKNIRAFATRMIKDHEMLIASMKPFAAKMDEKLPSGPPLLDRAKYEELKLKSGTSFDRAYVEAMVKDHHADLESFIKERDQTQNADLKAAVIKGEAVIKSHAEMIDNIAHMGGIETPPMPAGA
jgi:putative membrane protein